MMLVRGGRTHFYILEGANGRRKRGQQCASVFLIAKLGETQYGKIQYLMLLDTTQQTSLQRIAINAQ